MGKKKNYIKKTFGQKKNLWHTKFLVKKDLVKKEFMAYKNFWSKKH